MTADSRPEYRFDDRDIDWLPFRGFDGTVYDILDQLGGAVTREITMEDFRRGYERQESSGAQEE